MVLSKLISRLNPKKRQAEQAEKAREELKANAEKALRMKQEAGPADQHPGSPDLPRGHASGSSPGRDRRHPRPRGRLHAPAEALEGGPLGRCFVKHCSCAREEKPCRFGGAF